MAINLKDAKPVDDLLEELKSYKPTLKDNIEYAWDTVKDFFRNIAHYFKNWWLFTKSGILWHWRWWDYGFQNDLIIFGFRQMANHMEKEGHEVEESRSKRVAKIREFCDLIEKGYDYFSEEEIKSSNYLQLRKDRRDQFYNKLFYLIKGSDDDKDGSGYEGWWD